MAFDLRNVGVGVTAYEDPDLLAKCLDALLKTEAVKAREIVVYDDGSRANDAEVALKRGVSVFRSKRNLGSGHGRNAIFSHFLDWPEPAFGVAILDMDIKVTAGWLNALIDVMVAHPHCGIAAFPRANAGVPVYANDRCEEVMSLCSLYRSEALRDRGVRGPADVLGMDARMRCRAHDSELCQRMNRLSEWRVYLTKRNWCVPMTGSHSCKHRHVRDRREADSALWGKLRSERGWNLKDRSNDPETGGQIVQIGGPPGCPST